LRLTTGTVKWFNDSKGLGFVTRDDGGDELFADFSEVSAAGFKSLQENQKVSFDVKTGPKGKQAANIKPVWGKSASLNRTMAGPSGVVPSRRSRASPPGGRVAPGTFKSGIKREAQHQPEELHAKANRFDAFARLGFLLARRLFRVPPSKR
jgi:CspA family cold shock protein